MYVVTAMYANDIALSFSLRPPLLLPPPSSPSPPGTTRRWTPIASRSRTPPRTAVATRSKARFVVSRAQHGLASGGNDPRPRRAEGERVAAAVEGGGGDWGVFFGTNQHDPPRESRARPYRGARQHKQTGIRPSRARCACLKYMYQNKPAPHLSSKPSFRPVASGTTSAHSGSSAFASTRSSIQVLE